MASLQIEVQMAENPDRVFMKSALLPEALAFQLLFLRFR